MITPSISLSQKLATFLILFGIGSLLSFCIAIPLMGMADMKDGPPCGMDHSTELCPMMLNEHLGFWQKILVPTASNMSALFLLIILVVVFSLRDAAALEAAHRIRFFRYNANLAPPLVDYLRQAFSNGILHPKIY